ncbi:MAG: FecR family protein [Parasphingorhabdus sp.]
MTSEPYMNKKSALNEAIREQAVHWVLRQRDGTMAESDWEAFTIWLEADREHLICYDEAIEADDDLGVLGTEIAQSVQTDNETEPEKPSAFVPVAANNNQSWWAGFGAVAAVLLAAIVFWPSAEPQQFATLQTETGEIRELAIGPSISLTINGNSELAINEHDATVRMVRGEATYRINSEEPGALRVEVDNLVLVDHGTVFNIVRDKDMMRLAVTEGAVMINPARQKILVLAGNEIEMQLDNLSYQGRPVETDNVLAWQDGQLVFENRFVSSVIADVERNFATRISIPDKLKNQQITGVINLSNDQATVIGDVAAVLGGEAQIQEDGWIITD